MQTTYLILVPGIQIVAHEGLTAVEYDEGVRAAPHFVRS